jgi:hypothetical protein
MTVATFTFAFQAAAVLVTELVGAAVASSVVGGLLKSSKK